MIKEAMLYLFLTRAFIIFMFTMLYIVLVHYKKYDSKKFFENLIFCLLTFELSTTVLLIYIATKAISDLSKFFLLFLVEIFKKILGGKNGLQR
ncbi:MAG: hypothetical protein ACRCTZ_14985 [Sarcina sp.]